MDDIGPWARQIIEIKGAIRNLEVYPGGTTEWWLVPVATGTESTPATLNTRIEKHTPRRGWLEKYRLFESCLPGDRE